MTSDDDRRVIVVSFLCKVRGHWMYAQKIGECLEIKKFMLK